MDVGTMADRYDLQLDQTGWLGLLVEVLVAGLFVYVAARIVLDRSSIGAALATALLGFLVFNLLVFYVHGVLGIVLGVLAWSLVAAAFFRTRLLKGALIGLVAAVLVAIVHWLVGLLAR